MPPLQTYSARPIGVVADLDPANVPLERYTAARNMYFEEDVARRQPGVSYRTPAPLFAPEKMAYRFYNDVDQMLYAGQAGIGIDTAAQNDITPAGYPPALLEGQHNWTSLNGIPIWNHRGFTPHYHDGNVANPMLPIPAWPAGWFCNRMVAFKFYLIAIGGGDAGSDIEDQIRWSSSADPGLLPAEWTPTPENDAGDMAFADTPGPILDAVPLRDALVVYKGTGMYLVQFLGGIFVFGQRKLFSETGILGPGCVVGFRGRHYCVTEGDVLVHDGSQARSIADGEVRDAIFGDISGVYINRSFAYLDTGSLDFCFCFPSRDSSGWCDRRARYHLGGGPNLNTWTLETLEPDEVSDVLVGSYTISGLGNDWDSETSDWDSRPGFWDDSSVQNIGDQTLEAYHATTQFGQPQWGGNRGALTPTTELRWESKQLVPGRSAYVDHVWPILENPGDAEVMVSFGWQEDRNDPVTWSPLRPAINGKGVDVAQRGRYFSIRFTSEDSRDWQLGGFDIDFSDAGRYGG